MLRMAIYKISEFKTIIKTLPQINIVMNQPYQIDKKELDKTYLKLIQ